MSIDTLQEFITEIERIGELVRISAPVRAKLELCEIADRVMKQPGGGKALLFENVILDNGQRSEFPVAINLFGSMRRMSLSLGVKNLDEIGTRITQMMDLKVPDGLIGKLAMLPRLLEISKFPPRVKSGGDACQEVILRDEQVDLSTLPIITCWPEDGGPYITLPMVITRAPKRGIRNVGMYRIQVMGPRTMAMHWQRHKVGAAHWREMAERGEKMNVCIAIGADPASVYSASAPLPPMVDEFIFAGFLRKSPVSLTKAVTCDLDVPSDAEFVIEGYIDPAEELVVEGPFGDHTGFYSLEGEYPVFHVECVTHKKDPIYVTTVVGPPPQEDFYMGYAVERVFLPVMKMQYPEIEDVAMPAEGIFHNLMIVAIRKSYPGHARKIMNAIWSLGQAMFTKVIVVVDHDVDVHNHSEVVWKVLCALDPERDVQFSFGPMDTLDHAARMQDYGSKMGVDATRKWPTEGFTRPWPDEILMDEATKSRVTDFWKTLGL